MYDLNVKLKLILDLHRISAIKFGNFKLRSGIESPYYIDLRSLVYYPYLLDLTAEVFWEELRVLNFDVVVGVPYTGIPIATAIGLKFNQSMCFVRKEKKDYGTKKLVEGDFHPGQKAVLVDDVITNGVSKIETIVQLQDLGLTVEDIVVLLDREQGGVEVLREKGYNCHPLLRVNEILDILQAYKKISSHTVQRCKAFMKETKKTFLEAN